MGLKHSVNEVFFDVWSPDMLYVLGYLYADGNIQYSTSIRGKYVRVTSTDKDRICLIRSKLNSSHQIYIDSRGAYKKRYILSIGSGKLFDRLAEIGMTPRKSLTMLFPEIPEQYLSLFILGYFDGDGSVFLERSPSGNAKRLLTIFTSGSKIFLESLHEQLKCVVGVKGRGVYDHGSSKGTYQLRYSTRDSIRLFTLMYSSSEAQDLRMGRKYDIFTEYFKERGLDASDFPIILEKNGPMVK